MKLLFDANLSPTLVAHLRTHYHGSLHVRDIGLGAGSDSKIWEHAKAGAMMSRRGCTATFGGNPSICD